MMPDHKYWNSYANLDIINSQASTASACLSIRNLGLRLRFDGHNQQCLFSVLRHQNKLFFDFISNVQRCSDLLHGVAEMVGEVGKGNECFELRRAVCRLKFENDIVLMDIGDCYRTGYRMADFQL